MRKLSLMVFLLLGGVLVSCGDEASGPSGEGGLLNPFTLWEKSGTPTYGQLYATSQWSQRPNLSHYISGGEVFSNTSHTTLTDGGAMVASDLPIVADYPGEYRSYAPCTFGAVSVWSLAGGPSVGGFADSMYVPTEIKLLSPVSSATSVSRTQPLTVTWNVDPNGDSVLVHIEYLVEGSIDNDPSLPTTDYRWGVLTADNGSYTISATDLAGLPAGGLVQITLARGASKTSGTTSYPFHVYAYSTATALFKVIA